MYVGNLVGKDGYQQHKPPRLQRTSALLTILPCFASVYYRMLIKGVVGEGDQREARRRTKVGELGEFLYKPSIFHARRRYGEASKLYKTSGDGRVESKGAWPCS